MTDDMMNLRALDFIEGVVHAIRPRKGDTVQTSFGFCGAAVNVTL